MMTERVEVSAAPFARHAMRRRPDESGLEKTRETREQNLLELGVGRVILCLFRNFCGCDGVLIVEIGWRWGGVVRGLVSLRRVDDYAS